MKKNIILIGLFILILTLSSTIGYKVVSANTEITEENNIISYQQNLEQYITTYGYTIENPNIILNPYKISPLTALITFETPTEEQVTITVKGKDENTTYQKTYTPSKTHYLEVLGLYPDYLNTITITYQNIKKTIQIQTDPLPENLIPISPPENSTNELYFTKDSNYIYAIDNNGEIRWYIEEFKTNQLTFLENNHLLVSTSNIKNTTAYTGLCEIDLLGKIYNLYNISTGYNGIYTIKDKNILILSDNLLEIDRQNGTIIKEYKLNTTYNNISYQNNIIYLSNETETLEINTLNNIKTTNTTKLPQTSIYLHHPLYTETNYQKTPGLTFTTNATTTESKTKIFLINYQNKDTTYEKYNINIQKNSNTLTVTGNFSESDKVYIILDKFLDKKIYTLTPTTTTSYKCISSEDLEGKYSIYIKINNTIYKTNNYITF